VKAQAAEVLIVIGMSVGLLFLLLPLVTVLGELPAVWRDNRWNGSLVTAVVVLTGAFFLVFLGGIIALTFSGVMMR
jgi:hypothetical protein